MPVRKVGSKFAIGRGKLVFKTKAAAEKLENVVRAIKHSKRKKK